MPKFGLATADDVKDFFASWGNPVRKGKYVGFFSRTERLLVFVQGSSTDSNIYGYIEPIAEEDARAMCARLNVKLVSGGPWDWSAEHIRAAE